MPGRGRQEFCKPVPCLGWAVGAAAVRGIARPLEHKLQAAGQARRITRQALAGLSVDRDLVDRAAGGL